MPEIRRIVGEHVEGGPSQQSAIERFRQIRFDDQRAAGDIDE